MSVEGFLLQHCSRRFKNGNEIYQLLIDREHIADYETINDYVEMMSKALKDLDGKESWWIGCPPGTYWQRIK